MLVSQLRQIVTLSPPKRFEIIEKFQSEVVEKCIKNVVGGSGKFHGDQDLKNTTKKTSFVANEAISEAIEKMTKQGMRIWNWSYRRKRKINEPSLMFDIY